MAKAKKEYDNVFAKMIEFHNNEVVPFVKQINRYGPLKISRQRCLQYRDNLEAGVVKVSPDHFREYLILNKFIFDLLSKDEKNICIELMKSYNNDNYILSANMVYTLIENKKKEILDKLNENT